MDWPQEILKNGTLEIQFPAIWSLNFCCISSNLAGFGNTMARNVIRNCICSKKWGGGDGMAPSFAVPALS